MSEEDLTRTLTVKRSSKKKSGYSVSEEDGVYYLEKAPTKARVNIGDRIVGINGVPMTEFFDDDDANDLIESIRIVVVPKDKLDEYDGNRRDNDDSEDEEDYEEYDRRSKKPHANNSSTAIVPRETALAVAGDFFNVTCPHCNHENENLEPDEDGDLVCEECGHVIEPPSDNDIIYTCEHCNHKNENLEPDEDGDLVCEECGHVIEPPSDNDIVYTCEHCNHENRNLEPDEDGDLVCQECGHVILEDTLAIRKNEPKEDIYECPDCEHKNVNPEPDEEGDRVCEECGCILPEKMKYVCDVCEHENIDPEQNSDGDYICENCGSALDVEEEIAKTGAEKLKEMNSNDTSGAPGGGQEFDEKGKPMTSPDGKKLTPADMFSPGDVITVNVGKSNPKQDPGLKIDERNGKYYVRKVPSGGLFAKTPVIAGDKILELNGNDSHNFKNVNELKKILKSETKITVVVLRKDPDVSESSASSVDYDELKVIKPNGRIDEETDDETDMNTAPYDGEDCGCTWCPHCHK